MVENSEFHISTSQVLRGLQRRSSCFLCRLALAQGDPPTCRNNIAPDGKDLRRLYRCTGFALFAPSDFTQRSGVVLSNESLIFRRLQEASLGGE
jgi:hypothetical protein